MKFSIITPTYNRPEMLARCVQSMLCQKRVSEINSEYGKEKYLKYTFDFEMIIVNDSPECDYSIFENKYINHNLEYKKYDNMGAPNQDLHKIKYFKNIKNMGNNFSKNLALQNISSDSNYVIYLDDDDWLAADALIEIDAVLQKDKNIKWLVTNRTLDSGVRLTRNSTNKNKINYFWDYLMLKRFTGDATHIIKSDVASKNKFSSKIKNGEELYYFLQLPNTFIYKNINTTSTDGYSEDGMTENLKDKYKKNTNLLWSEAKNLRLSIYLILRSIKNIL